jgi:predicted metallopeptidase
MKYEYAPDLKIRMFEIIETLNLDHVEKERVECLRSRGSSTRRTLARCHTIGKLMQKAMKTQPFYAIEFLEPFERLSKDEQDKVIIHELMHIPKTFGGGFRQHDFVCDENVEILHEKFKNLKNDSDSYDGKSVPLIKEEVSPTKKWFWQ